MIDYCSINITKEKIETMLPDYINTDNVKSVTLNITDTIKTMSANLVILDYKYVQRNASSCKVIAEMMRDIRECIRECGKELRMINMDKDIENYLACT